MRAVPVILNDERVIGWQRDVLAAAAADADQHLSIGAPVTLAHRCVDYPRRSEVECTADDREVADEDRAVSVSRFHSAAHDVRNTQDDEGTDDGSGEVDSLELTTSGLDLPLLQVLRPRVLQVRPSLLDFCFRHWAAPLKTSVNFLFPS